ncbi:unnamed protein product [Leptidea sinapis]|uniref:Uncharacterized protein n=1 Tax=Leptidea sinapis TaxID=189913 RepID=A0A5E4R8A0_9NEOP|nr:unnamed protein product [Leptidea sinapis]
MRIYISLGSLINITNYGAINLLKKLETRSDRYLYEDARWFTDMRRYPTMRPNLAQQFQGSVSIRNIA